MSDTMRADALRATIGVWLATFDEGELEIVDAVVMELLERRQACLAELAALEIDEKRLRPTDGGDGSHAEATRIRTEGNLGDRRSSNLHVGHILPAAACTSSEFSVATPSQGSPSRPAFDPVLAGLRELRDVAPPGVAPDFSFDVGDLE